MPRRPTGTCDRGPRLRCESCGTQKKAEVSNHGAHHLGGSLERVLVSCFVLSLLGVTVADDQKVKEVTADSGWYRWEGTADGWIRKQGFTNIHGYAERPDDKVVETVTVEWQQPTLDTLGNNCKVRGRLVVPTGDPPGSRPVDWLQGIAGIWHNPWCSARVVAWHA